jgi:hypothetical protein
MPKPIAISKEMIDSAAFEMVRESGMEILSARNIAEKLKCSTQPIYKTYENMDSLKSSVTKKLGAFMMEKITGYRKTDCTFLNSGLGYIHFAGTEKVLFRLFCLESKGHNVLKPDDGNRVIRMLMEQELQTRGVELQKESRDKIFLQTMVFTYGMAVLMLFDNLQMEEDEIADMLMETFENCIAQETEKKI